MKKKREFIVVMGMFVGFFILLLLMGSFVVASLKTKDVHVITAPYGSEVSFCVDGSCYTRNLTEPLSFNLTNVHTVVVYLQHNGKIDVYVFYSPSLVQIFLSEP